MKKTADRTLSLGFLAAGACFLIDPFFRLFDFIPDFIGYLLILKGLSGLSDLDEHAVEAAKHFRRAALISAARIPVTMFVFGFSGVNEQSMEVLLFSFTFAVLDALVLIPAIREVGRALTTQASMHGGTALLEPARHTDVSATDRMTRQSIAFLLFRDVLSVLPELTVLSSIESGNDGVSRWSQVYGHIGLMRLLCAALVLIAGAAWLVCLFRFAACVRHDADFLYDLTDAHARLVLSNPGADVTKHTKNAFLMFGIGAALTASLFIDGIQILPDTLAAACFAAGALILGRRAEGTRLLAASCAVFVPINVIAVFSQSKALYKLASDGGESFTIVQNAARLARSPEELAAFRKTCLLVLVSQLCLIALLWLIRAVLNDLIDRYTGVMVTDASAARVEALHKNLRKQVLWLTIGGTAAALLTAAYMYGLPTAMNTVTEVTGTGDLLISLIFSIREAMHTVDLVVHIVYAVCAFVVLGHIRQEITYRASVE